MPREHGRRLAELLPQGRLIEIADSGTLIPEDQPDQLTRALHEFVPEQAKTATTSGSDIQRRPIVPTCTLPQRHDAVQLIADRNEIEALLRRPAAE